MMRGTTVLLCLLIVGIQQVFCQEEEEEELEAFRSDQRCGPGFVAPNGQVAICDKDGESPCCSLHGWCGSQDQFCTCPFCTDFRDYRQDGKCGENYPTWDDKPSVCDPDSSTACCDPSGDCVECSTSPYREDGRCGEGYPAPNGEPGECNPESGDCCSYWGYCGSSFLHCLG